MLPIGNTVYVDFRVVDTSSNPVAGLHLTDFTVVFRRNNAACADALTFLDLGSGEYSVTYTPSAKGHDYLELYNAANDLRVLYAEDIVDLSAVLGSGTVVSLTQDTGGSDALRVTSVTDPQNYQLQVYFSADWIAGRNAVPDAIGQSALDANGRWLSPVAVTTGTYHVIARKFRNVVVIKANLEV